MLGTAATDSSAATLPTIYGGMTDSVCASTDGTHTCNSCTGAGLLVCNQNSIYPTLLLQITMRSSTPSSFQGTPRVIWKLSGAQTGTVVQNNPTPLLGQQFTAQIKWSDLCGAMNITNCQGTITTTQTLNVGIDTNNDGDFEEKIDFNVVVRYVDNSKATGTACPVGIDPVAADQGMCDYTMFKGDEKVYISDFAPSSNDMQTDSSAVKYDRIIMFYEANPASITAVTNASPNVVLNVTAGSGTDVAPTIPDNRIRGLQNGTTYCFVMANMDQTGNISYYPDATILGDTAKICQKPDEVVGLLDDKSCFIATATFGSQMAPEVQTFRKFRNEFMLTNTFGKALVKAYYKLGPEAAEWVSHSELLRTLSVWMLWPILLFVKLSLALGLLPAALISLGAFIVLKKSFSHLWQIRLAKGDA